MINIRNNLSRVRILTACHRESLVLLPGVNTDINAELFEKISSVYDLESMQNSGDIVIMHSKSTKDLDSKALLQLISGMLDRRAVKNMLAEEQAHKSRSSVIKALEQKIIELTTFDKA